MNSRERVKLALEHNDPDRVPLMLWMTPEINERMQKHLGVNSELEVLEALDIDVRWLNPDYIGPQLKETKDERWDWFGIGYKKVENQFGSYEEFSHHPLKDAQTIEDYKKYQWPDLEWWDYDSINKHIDEHCKNQPRWLGVGAASIFERSWNVMGFEKMLFDMAINPEFVEAVMDGMLDFYLEQTVRMFEAAGDRIDMVYIADDLASQDALLISVDMYRRFLKPRWKKYIDTIKNRFGNHIKFHYHSCGAVAPLIPDLVEIGVDILNPIQPKANGMDPQLLKNSYGDILSFSGGLDIQDILPHGTVEQVKNEAKRLVKILGKDGGYIASAAHAIQPDTSDENIIAMIDGFKG